MALVLIKEDGTGKVDANAFANAADGDAYHDGHLYASAWTGATTQNKEKALVMATRLIGSLLQFRGVKRRSIQALQWPRRGCPDPDTDKSLALRLTADNTDHTLTFPADWKFLGTPAPTTLAATKTALLLLDAFGPTDPDLFAHYLVEP